VRVVGLQNNDNAAGLIFQVMPKRDSGGSPTFTPPGSIPSFVIWSDAVFPLARPAGQPIPQIR
jgi:hypothetical protein